MAEKPTGIDETGQGIQEATQGTGGETVAKAEDPRCGVCGEPRPKGAERCKACGMEAGAT